MCGSQQVVAEMFGVVTVFWFFFSIFFCKKLLCCFMWENLRAVVV